MSSQQSDDFVLYSSGTSGDRSDLVQLVQEQNKTLKQQLQQLTDQNRHLVDSMQQMQREAAEERQRLVESLQRESQQQQERLVGELTSMFKLQLELSSGDRRPAAPALPPMYASPAPMGYGHYQAPGPTFWPGQYGTPQRYEHQTPADPMRAMMAQFEQEGRQPLVADDFRQTASVPVTKTEPQPQAPVQPAPAPKPLIQPQVKTDVPTPKTTTEPAPPVSVPVTTTVPAPTVITFPVTPKPDPLLAKPKDQPPPAPATSVFGTGLSTNQTSFAALAASLGSGKPFGPASAAPTNVFAGSGTKLFSSVSSPDKTKTERARSRGDSEGSTEDHFEPNVDFTPLVPLPELVEVKTGEENEEALYSSRAKLYRFVPESNEFKERGVGDLRVLLNKQTSRVRVVMRREQVHKVCANFCITAQTQLHPMQKSDKAFTWHCKDFSEEELMDETLAARFKTPEEAAKFKKVVEDVVEKEKKREAGGGASKQEAAKPKVTTSKGFGDKFKPKPGNWECPGCMVSNAPDTQVCPCCQTSKDGKPPAEDSSASTFKPQTFGTSTASQAKPFGNFSFGIPGSSDTKTTTSVFSDPKLVPLASGQSQGPASNSVATPPAPAVTFPVSSKPDPAKSKDEKSTSIFDTGLDSHQTSFAALAASLGSGKAFGSQSPASSNVFAGSGTKLFANVSSPDKSRTRGDSEGSTEDHFEPNVEFTPLVPLPELVEVKTGEENEEALYSSRAKLYRFVPESNEFKERGVGDLRVLLNKQTSRVRVVMRREQVHKVCANFCITAQTQLCPMQKSDKAFTWHCKDFSEEELVDETLAARFKTPEEAAKFKKVVEDVVEKEKKREAGDASGTGKQEAAKPKETTAKGFGDKFKPKPGNWECPGCMVSNAPETQVCPCCQTSKDGKPPAEDSSASTFKPQTFGTSTASQAKPFGNFSFGIPGSSDTKTTSVFGGVKSETPTDLSAGASDSPKPALFGASASFTQSTPLSFGGFGQSTSKPSASPFGSLSFATPSAEKKESSSTSAADFSFKAAETPKALEKKDTSRPSPETFSFKLPTDGANGVEKLQLPTDFYDTKPACSGCLGCGTEEETEMALGLLDYLATQFVDGEESGETSPGEEEDELPIILEVPATLHVVSQSDNRHLGQCRVIYDEDVDGYRLAFENDDGKILLNHIICQEYSLNVSQKKSSPWYAEWTATDFADDAPIEAKFRLFFTNANARDQFAKEFREGVEFAKKGNISCKAEETVPLGDRMPDEYLTAMEALKSSVPVLKQEQEEEEE